MAIAFVSAVSAGSSGGGTFTTGAIDTTGANLIVLVACSFVSASEPTFSDSKGNTYTPRTAYSSSAIRLRILYVHAPTVGASHTFTATGAGAFGSLVALAFSGAATSSGFDQENGATSAAASTMQPGSVTPSENDEVLVTGVTSSNFTDPSSINSSFTIPASTIITFSAGNHFSLGAAYKIQTSAGAENPTWTLTGGSANTPAANIATFKVAGAAGGGKPWLYYAQMRGT